MVSGRHAVITAVLVAAAAALAVGCSYHASFQDCTVACTDETGCPDGFTCGDEGMCRPAGATAPCGDVIGNRTRVEVVNVRATQSRDLDLLFVIDNSADMAAKQSSFAAALSALFTELSTIEGGLPNLHVGVVSSDMGTKGSAVTAPGSQVPGQNACRDVGDGGALQMVSALVSQPFLTDTAASDGSRARNYTGAIDAAVGQMIALGQKGCSFAQHLAAMRAALGPGVPANAGFLRPTASLGVIVLADEDDCSVLDPVVLEASTTTFGPQEWYRCFQYGVVCDPDQPATLGAKLGCRPRADSPYIEDMAPFKTFLAGLKSDPHDVTLGVVAGAPTPVATELRSPQGNAPKDPAVAHSCSYMSGTTALVADPAIRFDALVRSFPGHARLESICSDSLSPQLARLAQTLELSLGSTCLDGDVAKGVAADCIVEDVVGGARTPIARCSAGGAPCWALVDDAARCPLQPQHLRLAVTRAVAPPADARTIARCVKPQ